ncbi:MAG: hypothetical protein UW03_C0006G0013 [Candidatus Peregrinibacteria bacterium GW2011_GWA2_43_8]|nr:MAG: hypothetical protein UW03_C0006G0013 [Candidatus Peregrinibacteria bacterium GW2011_GWA2_43_8]
MYAFWKFGVKFMPLLFPFYFLKFQVAEVPFTAVEVLVYILFCAFLLSGVNVKRVVKEKMFWFAGAFFLAAVISTFIVPASLSKVDGTEVTALIDAMGVLKGWVFMPLLYFVMAYFSIDGERDKKHMLVSFIWSGVILSIWAIYQVASGNYVTSDGRASAFYESANYLALYLGPICVLSLIMTLEVLRGRAWKKLVFLMPGFLVLAAMFFTKSYAGMIAVFAGFGFYLMLSKNFTRRFKIAACGLAWHASSELISEHPLFGIGLGQFEIYYQWKMDEIYKLFTYEWLIPHPHNFLMGIWLNFGLLGLISIIGVILVAVKRVHVGDGLRLMISALLFSILIHGIFDMPFMKNDLAMEFWFIIALLL